MFELMELDLVVLLLLIGKLAELAMINGKDEMLKKIEEAIILSKAQELLPSSFQPDPQRDEFLDEGEIELIDGTTWLDSVHIDAALTLLRHRFTDINGLFNVEWGATLSFAKAGNKWIQIIHNGQDHWLCAAQGFYSDDVTVYDSLTAGRSQFSMETHAINCIGCLGCSQNNNDLTILNMCCDRQDNVNDCGVYAIAFATALAYGKNPSGLRFDGLKLRSHLMSCFRRKQISLFPTLNATRERCEPPFVLTLPLFCHCRRSDAKLNGDWDLIQCVGSCGGRYHRMCDRIPQTVFDKEDRWICPRCVDEQPAAVLSNDFSL